MSYRLAVIPGDGIGPEVVEAGLALLDAIRERGGPAFHVERYPWGAGYYLQCGKVMDDDGLERLKAADAILLGAIGDPRVPDPVSVRGLLIRIRQAFDLYVNLRPVRLLPGVATPLRDVGPDQVDMVMVRENSEGEYAGIGGRIHQGTEDEAAVEAAYFSRRGIRRVAEFAFRLALRRRRKLTSITKSNALVHGMVFWDEVVAEVGRRFPEVELEPMLADAAALHLVRNPSRFDVVLASNLFGDILTDLGAAIAGGMGLAASANLDPERRFPSMFEPIHGSAPDIAGKGIANPLATFWSIALMLDHLGEGDWAARITRALERIFVETDVRTPDQGGRNTTAELTEAFLALLG